MIWSDGDEYSCVKIDGAVLSAAAVLTRTAATSANAAASLMVRNSIGSTVC